MVVKLVGTRAGLPDGQALPSYFPWVPHFHHLYKEIDKKSIYVMGLL